MNYERCLSDLDVRLLEPLNDFLPERIYDIHAHFYHSGHYPKPLISGGEVLDHREWQEALGRNPAFRGKEVSALFFGTPGRGSDTGAINRFIADEVAALEDSRSAALLLVTPQCDRKTVRRALREGGYRGIKVYHCYAGRADTMHAELLEYAPEWMWEAVNEMQGVVMLHMVLPKAIADERNQRDIRRLCEAYPEMKLILAHAARCFSHRHAVGMQALADLPNVYVDTSAVCEAASLLEALKRFGPRRVLYGSDFFISEVRGRCCTMGEMFHWFYGDEMTEAARECVPLVGAESLLALREALEEFGATAEDRENVFWNNAVRLLYREEKGVVSPQVWWKQAREVISCGTGLLSKRAESFLTPEWPVNFSQAKGARVWDGNGKMYRDFVGGVGAILLGYGDDGVNRAVNRRLSLGSYSSLLAPEEVELAEKLLALHPGMGKVRYARGGGDAVAVAVRIARAATGKSGVVFCGYHGWHDWSLAANLGCGKDNYRIPGLCPDGVPRELLGTATPFLYNQPESLQQACREHEGNLAAIVMEPLRSQYPTPAFFDAIRGVLQRQGALLVVDEVTSGLRYGYPGASSTLGLPADLLVYAKAMSNGVPFGVVIGKDGPMDAAAASFISSSYWTDGLGPAAALAVLNKMEREEVHSRLIRRGKDFKALLIDVVARFPSLGMSVGGMPASPTLIYPEGAVALTRAVTEEMIRRGFLLSKIIYLMDAHRDDDMALFLTTLAETLEVVAGKKERRELKEETLVGPMIGRLA